MAIDNTTPIEWNEKEKTLQRAEELRQQGRDISTIIEWVFERGYEFGCWVNY